MQVKAVAEAAARREAALQEQLAAVKAEAVAVAGDEGRLGAQLAAKEAELANLQLALGELSYEVGRGRVGFSSCVRLWCDLQVEGRACVCKCMLDHSALFRNFGVMIMVCRT